MADTLILVDPHMHLWDLAHIRYPWLTPPLGDGGVNGDVTPIARNQGVDDYLLAAQQLPEGWTLGGSVHVDAGAHPEDAVKESAWLQGLADTRGFPHGIVGYAALEAADAERVLAAHTEFRAMRGIRQILNWHADPAKTYTPRDLLRDDAWRAGFGLLARHDLSFDLQIYPGQMAAAADLAARHPDTLLILNHTGMPVDKDADGLALWRRGMAALSRQPNVMVKISGLGMLDRAWTVDGIRPFVLRTIELFGPGRCMFASNFPVDGLGGRLGAYFRAYDRITRDFSGDERAALFGGNAARVYRLD
ncbi:amidohydrolase family protein [Nitrospirillum iridis]|uniref:Putative TIM-barrel fold metal-dependent hydrolase n=1 Tax=Nitrospirillum iridis TaxID=765888 RepID=A0A7X0EFX9_9PROT|nr:amidohydrolase family protein [Nitrospirillum iridis]MBB6252959.1 putative TIM-barrel fold metal-dependent hydrolase [Nitrospirillum iridis]